MRAIDSENGWAKRNSASKRGRVNVRILRVSSEEAESPQAHITTAENDRRIGHPATLKSQTHTKEPRREKEKRKSTGKRREGQNTHIQLSSGKKKKKTKKETSLRDHSIIQKRTGALSLLEHFFVPVNSYFTLAYCFP